MDLGLSPCVTAVVCANLLLRKKSKFKLDHCSTQIRTEICSIPLPYLSSTEIMLEKGNELSARYNLLFFVDSYFEDRQ